MRSSDDEEALVSLPPITERERVVGGVMWVTKQGSSFLSFTGVHTTNFIKSTLSSCTVNICMFEYVILYHVIKAAFINS